MNRNYKNNEEYKNKKEIEFSQIWNNYMLEKPSVFPFDLPQSYFSELIARQAKKYSLKELDQSDHFKSRRKSISQTYKNNRW